MPDEFRDEHWESNFYKTTRRWIGYFDILGFKEFIKQTELLEAVRKTETTLSKAIKAASVSSCTTISAESLKDPILKSLTFSDSILFYIEPYIDFLPAFNYIVKSSAILIAKLIEKNFLLRGAISFGQLYVDYERSIFIGKGFNDAHSWENAQEWAGCIINPEMPDVWKILKATNSSWAFDSLTNNNDLIKFDVPLKKKVKYKEHLYAINWVKYLSKSLPPQKIQDFLKLERKKLSNKDSCIPGISGSSAIKLDNTLAFLKKFQNIETLRSNSKKTRRLGHFHRE